MSTCGCNSGLDEAIAAAKAATSPVDAHSEYQLDIELLYIDLTVCDRCLGTEQNLDEAISTVEPMLKGMGYSVNLTKTLVESEEQARALQFISSPTVRINGQDIQLEAKESHCSSCSSLVSDEPVDCRSWEYKGETFDAPPPAMLVEAIVRHLFDTAPSVGDENTKPYTLPDNLKRFFAARRGDTAANDVADCCSSSCDC